MNFRQLAVRLRDIPSTFRASTGPYINFLSVCETFLKISCSCQTFRQLLSTFCASAEPSIYFLCVCRSSIKFCQLFVCPWAFQKSSVRLLDLLSTPVNFPCGCGTFRQLSVCPREFRHLPSTFHSSKGLSVYFLCVCGTFRQLSVHLHDLQSTFGVSAEISVNFRQLSARPRDLLSTFRASVGSSVNFRYLFVRPRDPLSIFRASVGPSETFCTANGPSVNFSQFSVWLRDSVNFPCNYGTFCQLSMHPQDLPSTFHTSAGYSV